jgi:signal recognition particle subunit SRP72
MSDEEQIKAVQKLFKELKTQIKRENYSKGIATCAKILSKVPNDPHAVKCKCICYIHEQKFEKALDLASKFDFLLFERAYCLYRSAKLEEALSVLEEADSGENVLHLRAQILYKRGDFEQSSDVYASIVEENEEQAQSSETLVNLGAAFTAANSGTKALEFLSSADESDNYELLYNTACAMIQAGNLTNAEACLRKAETCCRQSLEADECPPEEIDEEVAVILTQLAYVLQLGGDTSKASAIYKRVLKSKPTDPAVAAAASNNTVVIRKVLSYKKQMLLCGCYLMLILFFSP